MRLKSLLCLGSALYLPALPAVAAPRQAAAPAAAADGTMRAFAAQIAIPHSEFTLANGLRVIVHTDRGAPVVAVSVWYNVGSKHEPAGRSGFAHLFEHLMFNGSENVPGDYLRPLQEAGVIDFNGTTSNDRTNYYQTVPTAALDRVLFMESDRMGHLLGAVQQSVLDEQRGVVENEKRQGDDSPYSAISDRTTRTLYPADHPYGHSVIGSMADLESANLADVRGWFLGHYGPNNAVLVLAGDIDAATARPLVEKYFGDIRRGPANVRPAAPVPTLPRRVEERITAPVTSPSIVRTWAVPGYDDADSLGLDIASGVMAQIDGAPLQEALVRGARLFDNVSVSNATLMQGGTFTVSGRVAKGVDPAVAAKALDAAIARFLATGPTADQLARWATSYTTSYARSLESLNARAESLANGILATGNPDTYRRDLAYYTGRTPAEVLAVARKWLSRPVYALTVMPGARMPDADRTAPPAGAVALPAPAEAAPPPRVARMAMPGVGDPLPPRFPAVTRARLSNGIELIYAQKTGVPFTQVSMTFPAGELVDPAGKEGRQGMMFSALEKGFAGHDSHWIEARKERLGLSMGTGATVDYGSASFTAPTVNLVPALDLLGDMLTRPTFPADEVAQLKRDTLAVIDRERDDADSLVQRVLPRLIDAHSPYAQRAGFGDPKVIAALTPADLAAAHAQWLRPDGAKIFVVSDRPLAELKPMIERTLGGWRVAGAAPALPGRQPPAPAQPQIVLIDRPGSAQATIGAGQAVPAADAGQQLLRDTANGALGGGFLGRINMNLREDKHWSYGANGNFDDRPLQSSYVVDTSVQSDKAGPAIAEIRREVSDFVTTRPMTQREFDLVRGGALRGMAGWFQSSGAVLGAMQENDRRGRPDDYFATLDARYAAMTPDALNAAIRAAIDPARWVWTVVGDAGQVRAQLDALGLPVRVVRAGEVVPRP